MRTGLDIEYEAIDKSSCYAGIVDRDGRPLAWAVMHLQKIDPKSPGTVTLYIGPGYEQVSRRIAFMWMINSLGEVKHRGYGTYFELDYKGRLSPEYEEQLSTVVPQETAACSDIASGVWNKRG